MKLGLFHFQLLYQILERIHYIYEEEGLAKAVLESISTALNAEGGTVFKYTPNGDLYPLASYGTPIDQLRKLKFQKGKGVVGWVVTHGQPVKVDNPQTDQRFGNVIDSRTGFKTKTILAAPIMTKGEVVGVIEFLNRKDGVFTIPDLELVSMIGREVGIAFENVSLIKDLTETRSFLNAMTDSFSAGILAISKDEKIIRLNPSALRILKLEGDPQVWAGKPLSTLLEMYPEFLKATKVIQEASKPLQRQSVKITSNNQARTIGYSGFPVIDPQGNRIASALLFQDITAYVKK